MTFKWFKIFVVVVSILILIIGILSASLGNRFVRYVVDKNIRLESTNEFYKSWLNPPVDVYLNFYLFNLKNSFDFYHKGAKPIFEEIGPFVYKEYVSKEYIVDNLNSTLSYKQRKYYKFVPELSPFNESHEITTINIAAAALVYKLRYMPSTLHTIVNLATKVVNETFLITKPVNKLLFGYKDNFLTFLKKFNQFDKNLIPTDEVGLFFNKNNTIDGTYTIFTGQNDTSKLGLIEKFNGLSSVNYWSSPYANMINGSDGTIFPPFLTNKTIYAFNPDICRSVYASYNETIHAANRYINLIGFKPDESLFASYKENPDNEGFCTPKGNCLENGVLNISNCYQGVPIITSHPHFLFADELYKNSVIGLEPNISSHLSSFYLEEYTSVPMQANLKMQINLHLIQDSRINFLQNITEIITYPLYWCDENFKVDKNTADDFYYKVLLPLRIINIGKFVVLIFAVVLLVLSIGCIVDVEWKKKRLIYQLIEEELTTDEDAANRNSTPNQSHHLDAEIID